MVKAVGSALIEGGSLAQNIDNVFLGVAGAQGSLVAVIGYPSVATAAVTVIHPRAATEDGLCFFPCQLKKSTSN